MSYGGKEGVAVYEAHEEDYDFDQYGRPLRHEPARPTSDTPDSVYWDDNSLLDCWAAALLDFKFKHPSRFAPLQQAPQSLEHKSKSAPLWYGPYNASASTSANKSTANDRKRKATANKSNDSIKKSKSTPPTTLFSPKLNGVRSLAGVEVDSMETDVIETPPSPAWTPPSPDLPPVSSPLFHNSSAIPLIATAPPSSLVRLPPPHLLPPSALLPPSTALLPPTALSPPTAAPRIYPAPPAIPDIEPGLAPTLESPEELLQDALWAWYNAGYQTALYHSAMGAIEVVGTTGSS